MAIIPASSRKFRVSTLNNGDILDFGPASNPSSVGTFTCQFIMSLDFVGGLIPMGRIFGPAAKEAGAPFLQIPYRRVVTNALPSDFALVADPITAAGIIQVASNGLALGMLVACTAGYCDILTWDLAGPMSY